MRDALRGEIRNCDSFVPGGLRSPIHGVRRLAPLPIFDTGSATCGVYDIRSMRLAGCQGKGVTNTEGRIKKGDGGDGFFFVFAPDSCLVRGAGR